MYETIPGIELTQPPASVFQITLSLFLTKAQFLTLVLFLALTLLTTPCVNLAPLPTTTMLRILCSRVGYLAVQCSLVPYSALCTGAV